MIVVDGEGLRRGRLAHDPQLEQDRARVVGIERQQIDNRIARRLALPEMFIFLENRHRAASADSEKIKITRVRL